MKLTRKKLRQLINEALEPFFFTAAPSNEIQMLIHDPKVTDQQLKQLLREKDPEMKRSGMELFLSDPAGYLNMPNLKDAEKYLQKHYPSLYTQYQLGIVKDPIEPADPIEKASPEYQKHFGWAQRQASWTKRDISGITHKYALEKAFEAFFSKFQNELYDIASTYPETNSKGEENFSIDYQFRLNDINAGSATISFPEKEMLEKIKAAAEHIDLKIARAGIVQHGRNEPFRLRIIMPNNHFLITGVRDILTQTQA